MPRPALPVDFLLWLHRYIGTWDYHGQAYTIRRRNDGWLEAAGPDHKVASLNELLARGKRIKPAQSPLGMYPVVTSQALMELWLKPEEMNRLRNAWHVGYGMRLIVEAIERNIRESDDATRRAKCEKMWLLGRSYNEPWTEDDSEVYRMLLAAFEADMSRQAQKLGITRRRVRLISKLTCNTRLVSVHCAECGTVITVLHGVADNNRTVWCLSCLAERSEATFGQRLKAYRLAAGLTLTALERRSGVDHSLISAYECDRSEPKWQTLAKLIRVLGVEWLAVK